MTFEHPFLRAINLQYDAEVPERIAHYEPTAKAVPFLKGVSGQTEHRAFFVIAPYGSGKSLGATYLLQLLENRKDASASLRSIRERLSLVSPDLANFAKKREKNSNQHAVVITLEGAVEDLGQSVAKAASASLQRIGFLSRARKVESLKAKGLAGAVAVIDHLAEAAQKSSAKNHIDRIAIVWDEFGRHVEQLVRSGRPDRLAEIQSLAEYAARRQDFPTTFGLIMHQGLLQYASGLSQAALAEWRKIEGRFEPIQYVDDSREVYWLIGKVVANNRPSQDLFGEDKTRAKRVRALGLFHDFAGSELDKLLDLAGPLEPATLHVLPQLAARVAQHERTLFSFLLNTDLSRHVTADQLYDYFATAMQADTALGGTYRKWLETESALSKAEDDDEARALKTASILELGLSGQRQRVTRDLLEFALGGGAASARIVDRLLKRKLLLHRRRSDQVSLWHGTDVDLRGRLEEEIARHGNELDIVEQLNADFRPAAFRPVRHNDRYCIRRYFSGMFTSVDAFSKQLSGNELFLESGQDGRILYLVPENEAERIQGVKLAKKCREERVVVVVPDSVTDLHGVAMEVSALERMAVDEALLAEDPLLEKELQQMLDEAQAHLHAQVGLLTTPGPHTHWYHAGKILKATDVATLLARLSDICDKVFPQTPRINNEMIVRHRLSGPLVNARKKVLLGILERHGQERVGIQGESADASVFRTVLDRTGIYRPNRNGIGYRYAEPREVKDTNLKKVWQEFKTLVTRSTKESKDLEQFFTDLTEPPIGMRRGVLPIFFASALRAFQSTLVITDEKGEYLDDLLPSHIESICNYPESYTLKVFKLDTQSRRYLDALTKTFAEKRKAGARNRGDLMRKAYDAFEAWRENLPPGAKDSRVIGEKGQRLQALIRAPFSPYELFFKRFPKIAGSSDLSVVEAWIVEAKAELDGVLVQYRTRALESLDECLQLGNDAPKGSVRLRFKHWQEMLPGTVSERLGGMANNLLNLNLDFYKDDEAFINAVATLVVGRGFKRWGDADLQRFGNEISSLLSRIEESALADSEEYGEAAAELIERRLKTYVERLVGAVGADDASQRFQHILRDLESNHDKLERSASNG